MDPFGDAAAGVDDLEKKGGDANIGGGLVHIRIQQRNGRKTLTTVQGITEKFDKKKLVRAFKKEFACNGTVVEHDEYGEVIQLQGDQRNNVCQFLIKIGIVKEEQLKVTNFEGCENFNRLFADFWLKFSIILSFVAFSFSEESL